MLSNLSNASSQSNNIIKLTYYDETKKRAHDSYSTLVKSQNAYAMSWQVTFENQLENTYHLNDT